MKIVGKPEIRALLKGKFAWGTEDYIRMMAEESSLPVPEEVHVGLWGFDIDLDGRTMAPSGSKGYKVGVGTIHRRTDAQPAYNPQVCIRGLHVANDQRAVMGAYGPLLCGVWGRLDKSDPEKVAGDYRIVLRKLSPSACLATEPAVYRHVFAYTNHDGSILIRRARTKSEGGRIFPKGTGWKYLGKEA